MPGYNLTETSAFTANVPALDYADAVQGATDPGSDPNTGASNQQAVALANRTKYLKAQTDAAVMKAGSTMTGDLNMGGKDLLAARDIVSTRKITAVAQDLTGVLDSTDTIQTSLDFKVKVGAVTKFNIYPDGTVRSRVTNAALTVSLLGECSFCANDLSMGAGATKLIATIPVVFDTSMVGVKLNMISTGGSPDVYFCEGTLAANRYDLFILKYDPSTKLFGIVTDMILRWNGGQNISIVTDAGTLAISGLILSVKGIILNEA